MQKNVYFIIISRLCFPSEFPTPTPGIIDSVEFVTEIEPTLSPGCSSLPEDPCPMGEICLVDDCYPGCKSTKPCPMGMECIIKEKDLDFGYDLYF